LDNLISKEALDQRLVLVCAHEIEVLVAITIQNESLNSIRFKYSSPNSVCIHPLIGLIGLGPVLAQTNQHMYGVGNNT
jgi:hypothetical protein